METPFICMSNEPSFCPVCGFCGTVMNFPCGHKICTACYHKEWERILGNLERIFLKDFRKLNLKAGSIGCWQLCEQSRLSVPVLWLQRLFLCFNQERLSELIGFLSSFLSGFQTYFYMCVECGEVHAGVRDGECNGNVFKYTN